MSSLSEVGVLPLNFTAATVFQTFVAKLAQLLVRDQVSLLAMTELIELSWLALRSMLKDTRLLYAPWETNKASKLYHKPVCSLLFPQVPNETNFPGATPANFPTVILEELVFDTVIHA